MFSVNRDIFILLLLQRNYFMKILHLLISFLLILPIYSFSQDGNAYGSFSGKEAKKILKKARKDVDYGNLKEATDKYSQLLKTDSNNSVYNYELALTLYNNYEQIKSIPYFERAIKNSKDTIGEAFYFLATAWHLAGNGPCLLRLRHPRPGL